MASLLLVASAGSAVAFLRCARDCFGSCPIYLGASECCGPRSFCGWAAEPPVQIHVPLFKTYVQTIRGDTVPLECNVHAEPYLSLGSSLSTCALSALEISQDEDYFSLSNGQRVECDMVRRITIGNSSIEACQESLAVWGALFGLTPRPTAQPTVPPTASPILPSATTMPTEAVPTTTLAAEPPTNSTDHESSPEKRKITASHIILIVSLVCCVIFNIGLAVLLQKKRIHEPPSEPAVVNDNSWEDPLPTSMTNPMYENPGDLDPAYNAPMEAPYEEPVYDAGMMKNAEVLYDPATVETASTNSNC